MPTYVYQIIFDDDEEGPTFEIEQSISEPALTVHPITGHKVRRLILAPNISTKFTQNLQNKIKDNAYLEKKGFTKYEKDKLTGTYHRVAGSQGPDHISPK